MGHEWLRCSGNRSTDRCSTAPDIVGRSHGGIFGKGRPAMATLEIIGAPQSNFVRTVRIACMEKGVPYTLIPARPHTPEVDAIHPFGKIPAMRHGEVTLCESTGICVYIDRTFDGPPLIPRDATAGARVVQ